MAQRGAKRGTRKEPFPLALASAEELLQWRQELRGLIAQRAYELFERRGGGPGHEDEDWVQAEREILRGCRHDIVEQPDSLRLRAELPGNFAPGQIKVSVEPRRVMVRGEQRVTALRAEGRAKTTRAEPLVRRIFRIHELPADVDPSRCRAILSGEKLEVVMPKRAPADT